MSKGVLLSTDKQWGRLVIRVEDREINELKWSKGDTDTELRPRKETENTLGGGRDVKDDIPQMIMENVTHPSKWASSQLTTCSPVWAWHCITVWDCTAHRYNQSDWVSVLLHYLDCETTITGCISKRLCFYTALMRNPWKSELCCNGGR